jgi:hypothetical protein
VSTGTDDVVATPCTSYAEGAISTTLDAVSGSSSLHDAAATTSAELIIRAAPQRRTDDNMADHSRQRLAKRYVALLVIGAGRIR